MKARRDGRLTIPTTPSYLRTALPPGQRVLRTAVRVEVVPAARQLQRTEILVVVLAVVADLFHDPVGPLVVDAELLAEGLLETEEATHLGIGRALLDIVDVLLRDAEYLGLQHRHVRPVDQN